MSGQPETETDPSLDPFNLLVMLVFLALILGLVGAGIVVDYQPAKLTVLFIVLFWMPLLVLHEIGHALAAMLLGWQVVHVSLGIGQRLASFELGSALVDLRIGLVEGFVSSTPVRFRRPQVEHALIYFAGPGIELIALGVLALAVGPGELLTSTDSIPMLMAQSLAVALLMGVFINLFPHTVSNPNGTASVSDGLGMVQSLQRPDSYYQELLSRKR